VDSATAASQNTACLLSVHYSANVPYNDLVSKNGFIIKRLDYNVRKAYLNQIILKLV
jgi:hypothetical protein